MFFEKESISFFIKIITIQLLVFGVNFLKYRDAYLHKSIQINLLIISLLSYIVFFLSFMVTLYSPFFNDNFGMCLKLKILHFLILSKYNKIITYN